MFEQTESDFVIENFETASGERFETLRQHAMTIGTLRRDAAGRIDNAVLLLHNTTGSGREWLGPGLSGELFGPGQPLDAARYFLIVPDAIGFGRSSKPSDGLRAKFPQYRYGDIVAAQHRLLTEGLGVEHLRMIVGLSMGGMLAWLWGGLFPGFMDALVPIACQPAPMSGRNWLQRRMQIELIRNDPGWHGGDYTVQPRYYARAPFGALMTTSPVHLQRLAPTRAAADALYQQFCARAEAGDANDRLYQLEASMDYDPTPLLARIEARILAINFADDELNPAALGTVEAAIAGLKAARAVMLAPGPEPRGHQAALHAALWKAELQAFVAALE
ncbi:homoserine O-acetyltransferase [Aquabacter spiritensis]|uniref:Homoserine O-acetyltransferase n=2 Tax=Aquabacter spiritensis TaxID=933073 RepID=A0A4R3M480_9HYPH|nr:homoserine O-acetyltransferase [Aquabacter spiritensis]